MGGVQSKFTHNATVLFSHHASYGTVRDGGGREITVFGLKMNFVMIFWSNLGCEILLQTTELWSFENSIQFDL